MDIAAQLVEGLPPHAAAELAMRHMENMAASRQVSVLAQYAADPSTYARAILGARWWAKQVEIAESVRDNRRTAVYAGHSVGKTHAIGGIVQWHFDCFHPSITLTTAPSWASIHDLLWGEIRGQRPATAPGRLLELRLESGPKHYAKGHNAESGAGFQGRHEGRQLIVIDEAQGIQPYIWEATNAMMTSPDCRTLVSGNPTETGGPYYDIREDPDWNIIHISCLDHPNIGAELAGLPAPYPKAVSLLWVEEMIRRHTIAADEPDADCIEWPPESGVWRKPDDVFRSRVLGLTPRQASTAIWSEAWLVRAREGGLAWAASDLPAIGADIARFGDNLTVLYGRRGPVVTDREAYPKQGLMETVGRIVRLAESVAAKSNVEARAIPIHIDDTGLGGGVTDRLRELEFRVYPVNFGERAENPGEYYNRGSELWFRVGELGREARLDLSRLDPDTYRRLSSELRARRYRIHSDRTLRVESKEEIVKRIGRSPDDADALALAFSGQEPLPKETVKALADPTPSRFSSSVEGSRWSRGDRTGWRS